MRRIYSPVADERGAALVLALLVMMVLAVFSTVAIMSATQGLRISGKYKTQQQAVYTSDGGAEFASGLIRDTIGNKKLVSAAYLAYVSTANTKVDATTDLEKEIAGINGNIQNTWTSLAGAPVTGVNPDSTAAPNATVTIMGDTASIDIDFTLSKLTPGSSTEFAARYEGIGSGTAGSVQLFYQIDTYSKIADTEKTVRATYKCVEGGGRCL